MSAQKQCPKCGEKNPAEAVMCWACYTSLTGGGAGATALAGAGGTIGAASIPDTEDKKKIDPKHLAIIGIGLLVAVGFGVNTMMGSGESEDDQLIGGMAAPTTPTTPSNSGTTQPPAAVSSGVNPVGPEPPTPGEIKGVIKEPYIMLSAPNLRYAGATLIIAPTEKQVTATQAKALASIAYTQIQQRKKFVPVEIFVFGDEQAAQSLVAYQNRRQGAPLTSSDYVMPNLAPAWKGVLIRQRSDSRGTSYSFPQTSPSSFWAKDGK